MDKLVSIIIPFHDEDTSQLSIVLSSINNQIGVDFKQVEVILIGDGGNELPPRSPYLLFKNINIQYHYFEENGGPGVARQRGMDHATGKYIMFMDGDDQFQFVGALLEFFNVIKDHGDHEIIIAKYLQQTKNEKDEFVYFTHKTNDWKAAYAKWFNVDYLKKIDLRWRDDLTIYEDTYFVGMACELAEDIYHLETVVYTWMWNENSIVRRNNFEFNHQMDEWARVNHIFLDEIRVRKPEYVINDFVGYMSDLYFREGSTTYLAADKEAYELEQILLLKDNEDLWDVTQDRIARDILKKIEQRNLKIRSAKKDIDLFLHRHKMLLEEKLVEK